MKESDRERGDQRPNGWDYEVSPSPNWKDIIVGLVVVPPILAYVLLDQVLITPLREKLHKDLPS